MNSPEDFKHENNDEILDNLCAELNAELSTENLKRKIPDEPGGGIFCQPEWQRSTVCHQKSLHLKNAEDTSIMEPIPFELEA